MQDMNEMQANAWIYWQAVENGEKGNWWGLMQVCSGLPTSSLAKDRHEAPLSVRYPAVEA